MVNFIVRWKQDKAGILKTDGKGMTHQNEAQRSAAASHAVLGGASQRGQLSKACIRRCSKRLYKNPLGLKCNTKS